MTIEQYTRAICIYQRLQNLENVLDEINPTTTHKLTYVDEKSSSCSGWKMKYISEMLDAHDVMIRKEIQNEIDELKAEIERL